MSSPITKEGVLKKLVGLDGWLQAARESISNYDDAAFAEVIGDSIRLFETESHYRINQTLISSLPDGAWAPVPAAGQYAPSDFGVIPGTRGGVGGIVKLPQSGIDIPYQIEEPYAYFQDDAEKFAVLALNQTPILTVLRARIAWDAGATVFPYPQQWVKHNKTEMWLLPITGTAIFTAAALSWSMLQLSFGAKDYVPGIIAVDYVAGLETGWENDPQYRALRRTLEEACAYKVLCDISEAFDAGEPGMSLNSFGNTEQRQWTRFRDRKQELLESVQAFGAKLDMSENGPNIVFN